MEHGYGSNKLKMENTPTVSWGIMISGTKILGKQILVPKFFLYFNPILWILV